MPENRGGAIVVDVLREMAVLIEHPFLALIPATTFGLLSYKFEHRLVRIALWSWLAYTVYEFAMKFRILCSDECNIRIDLLLLYPALILVSMVALFSIIFRILRKGNT